MRNEGYQYQIIASVDGDDGTREILEEMAKTDPTLDVVSSVERRGKGHGIRRGVAIAKGEIIGFADADDKTPIEEFDKFVPWLREGFEVVIGSRRLGESRIERSQPLYRRLGSRAFARFVHAVLGLDDIVDTQCGFKFFQRRAALELFGNQRIDGYMFDVEILCLAQRTGYRIAQVPITWRDDGESRLSLLGGNLRNVLDILRIRARTFGRASTSPKG